MSAIREFFDNESKKYILLKYSSVKYDGVNVVFIILLHLLLRYYYNSYNA